MLTIEALDGRDLPSQGTLAVATGLLQGTEFATNFVATEYRQLLGRNPDASGASYWLARLQAGASPESVEAGLAASAEYVAGQGHTAWVTSLYQDLLGRAPDTAGLNGWRAGLASGTVNRAQVATGFATSPERQARVIASDYQRYLGRAPEAAATQTWLAYEAQGHTRHDVAIQIVASDEFFRRQGSAAGSFITATFRTALTRSPSTTESANWLTVYNRAGAVTGSFDIAVRTTGLTAAQQQIFAQAAARWEEIITGDLPNATYQGTAVDDVLIDAVAVPIDGIGDTLGQAGPDRLRSGSSLPVHGSMEFDTADLADLEASGQLYSVILHEMGHVLGIGTIWETLGLLSGADTTNPRFLGSQATAAYNAEFGTNATSVPVEGRPSPAGSRDGHWRESVFGNELMTPYISGSTNPISRVTVASLADLGYAVNRNAADE